MDRPIVALESTIITHGMPYPSNLETALQVEKDIREQGAIPATIAIVRGKVRVGLGEQELEELAKMPREKVLKCSRRDIVRVVYDEQHDDSKDKYVAGSTTVAATMLVCHMVGIKVFATGGIGGVHRSGDTRTSQHSMDISADLMELGRTPVAVVCAGVKSILDIPRTLEVLETQGVTVAAYGTDEFPAFFTRRSGCKAPFRVDAPQEVARMIRTNSQLNLGSGMLVAVPVPQQQEANTKHITESIERALKEADEKGIMGKESTPFLLGRVNELTGGESLQANIALIRNNSRTAAQIACAYSKLMIKSDSKSSCNKCPNSSRSDARTSPDEIDTTSRKTHPVVVIGGCVVDVTGKSNMKMIPETSNPGETYISMGGVARNVNEALARLGVNPLFIGAIGRDSFGNLIERHFSDSLKITTRGLKNSAQDRTAIYSCILDNDGELVSAIADMDILEKAITANHILKFEAFIARAALVFIDANLNDQALKCVAKLCQKYNVSLFFEPTSVPKSVRCVHSGILPQITFMKPNKDELFAMADAVLDREGKSKHVRSVKDAMNVLLDAGVKSIIYSAGAADVIVATVCERGPSTASDHTFFSFPVRKLDSMVSATGAGDSFCAGFVFGCVQRQSLENCVKLGCESARLTLQSKYAVAEELTAERVLKMLQ